MKGSVVSFQAEHWATAVSWKRGYFPRKSGNLAILPAPHLTIKIQDTMISSFLPKSGGTHEKYAFVPVVSTKRRRGLEEGGGVPLFTCERFKTWRPNSRRMEHSLCRFHLGVVSAGLPVFFVFHLFSPLPPSEPYLRSFLKNASQRISYHFCNLWTSLFQFCLWECLQIAPETALFLKFSPRPLTTDRSRWPEGLTSHEIDNFHLVCVG